MIIKNNLEQILRTIPKDCTLIAVSKTHPSEILLQAYESGQRIFGENKVQELATKYEGLPKDIKWHLIGHLQSNKVKYIAPFVALIHSVDSLSLLEEINKQALKNNRTIGVLLQFHIAEEETKFGLEQNSDMSEEERQFCINAIRNSHKTKDKTPGRAEATTPAMETTNSPNPKRTRRERKMDSMQSSAGSVTKQGIHKMSADHG